MEKDNSDMPYELTNTNTVEEDTTSETQPKENKLRRLGCTALAGLITYGALKSGSLEHIVPKLAELGPYELISTSISMAALTGQALRPGSGIWHHKK